VRREQATKEFEDVRRSAERQGWTVTRGRKYFKMKCPCADRDMKMMHITPRQHYLRNFTKTLQRDTCCEEDR